MQPQLAFGLADLFSPNRRTASDAPLWVGSQTVPLKLVRHPRARRYRLRVLLDGTASVTVPRGGTLIEARRFAESQTPWMQRQLQRLAENPPVRKEWKIGTPILFRGETILIELAEPGTIRFSSERVSAGEAVNVRPAIEKHLHALAARELPLRVAELAAQHGLSVRRVTVRNQKSRWGSCSRRGTVSLNWRLIQAPAWVRDYIILHELMHLRQMNHSARFWREVENVCPDYPVAERWMKQHAELLR
jgi:hypothetical protein